MNRLLELRIPALKGSEREHSRQQAQHEQGHQ
jgi:hypothetical protein